VTSTPYCPIRGAGKYGSERSCYTSDCKWWKNGNCIVVLGFEAWIEMANANKASIALALDKQRNDRFYSVADE
jgi:hypothetical protein